MSENRAQKMAEQIAKKTKKMLEQLPEDARLVRGTEVLSKKDLNEKFEKEDEFAADLVGDVAATMLEHAIRKSKKSDGDVHE